ncbi:MAG: hypothetical protein Q8876_02025 [Bacillota bacterium]|nr:hypothetical protein [Bacillota bacterium]
MKQNRLPSLLVCVTGQRECIRLIKIGKEIAEKENLQLHVLSVLRYTDDFENTSEQIEFLYQGAHQLGAEMSILFNENAALSAAGFARDINAQHIVTGMPGKQLSDFIGVIHVLTPTIPLSMVTNENVVYNMVPVIDTKKSKKKQQVPA